MKLFWILFLIAGNVLAGQSEELRASKKYEAKLQGGFDYRMDSTQGSFGIHLNPDDIISFKAGAGSSNHRKQTSAAFQYKHFEGNSFFIAPEIYYVNYHHTDDDNFFNIDPGHISTLGVGFRIGNQWHFKYFTVGFDWIGVGRNLAYWSDTSADKYHYTFTLLNMFVGGSF